jgi:hypothetical protein
MFSEMSLSRSAWARMPLVAAREERKMSPSFIAPYLPRPSEDRRMSIEER